MAFSSDSAIFNPCRKFFGRKVFTGNLQRNDQGILWQFRLAGIFDNLAGLIVGQFTDYKYPSRDHADMYAMIDSFLSHTPGGVPFPVAMDVPVGHIDENHPLILNLEARLEVSEGRASLRYH